MVAKLKLKGIDGRSPPEVEPAVNIGYPLNLSILISGGKENNYDYFSNGE